MITVPRSSNDNQPLPGPKPDEAMMLMALAHMKQIGSIPDSQTKLASMTSPQDLGSHLPTRMPIYDKLKLEEKEMEEEQPRQDMLGGENVQRTPRKEQKI